MLFEAVAGGDVFGVDPEARSEDGEDLQAGGVCCSHVVVEKGLVVHD